MAFVLISICLLLPYAVLILYYRNGWTALREFVPSPTPTEMPFVSVIIAARNEEKNIGNCIRSLARQTYPENQFEIIVTDDHSSDRTVPVIESFHLENLRVIHLADFIENKRINSYKKKSIEAALQFAKGTLIVTTDADCRVPPKWIETLVSFYSEKNPVFVAMPVVFPPPEGKTGVRLLSIFQSLDFMTLQGITGASIHKKVHSMCNGANLSYKKKAFDEAGGFEGIDHIASGDDMLLMYKIQKKRPDEIMFLKSRSVMVQTEAAETLQEFIRQRIRWASKAGQYSDKKITAVLGLVYLFNAWILVLGISSFFFTTAFYVFLTCIAVKTGVELFFLYPVSTFFGKQKLLWWFLPAQPFHILYIVIAGWLGKSGSYQWKGRKVQ